MMDNREDIITDPLMKRIAELEKEIEKLKLQQLIKSTEIPKSNENKEKQHLQDDSLPSTSQSTSIGVIALPLTSSMEFNKISTTTPDEFAATTTGNFGKTFIEKAQNENDEEHFSVYKKREGTNDEGKEYEYLMCAYYALKLCFDKNVDDFEITTNHKDYGDFDDVALKVTFGDNSTHHFLMQMKHTEQYRGITDNMLSAKKGDFSILKYFESYQKLQDGDNFIFIVFTNRKSHWKDKSEFKLENENIIVNQCQPHSINHLLIDTVSDDQTAHIFDFKQNGQNSQNFQDFFKSFYLFTNQKNSSKMQLHIDKLLYERFGCKVDFIGFMRQWWKGKFVLHKHDIIVKLAELVLSPFVQEIPEMTGPLSTKEELLKNVMMQFEMTLVKDCDVNSVAKIWMEESSDLEMMSKASHKYGLTAKGLGDLIVPQEFTKVLWYLNKVPLIVKYDEKEEKRIRNAIELLAVETDKKRLVLVGQKLEETLSKRKILESLYDLKNSPLYKKIVAKFRVSLQGRESIHLEKFISSDIETAKLIKIKDLFLMLEKDLIIGKSLPKLPAAYIPRTLKRDKSLAFEEKAFTVFNNPVNIVIGKPGIGKSTLMTYLSHQCPPDYWCVRINLIEFGKFISEGHSTEEIMNKFLKDEDPFFDKVKATFLKNKKIYFLLDGLDEIDANCVKTVLTFIKDISSNGIHVWVSSRGHLKDKLSKYFEISPITVEELTEENQEKYIEQRLCDKSEGGFNYTEEEAKEIITRLFASVNVAYNSKNILGVPLLLFIITEIFRNDKSNFEEIMKEDIFVLTKMYNLFFQGKEEHQDRKAGVQNKRALGNRLNYQLKQYELPALEPSAAVILPKLKLNSKKLNKSHKFLEEIRNEGDPLGIISHVVGEKKQFRAIFSHQSFAEYFACVWLKKNKDKLEMIKDSFFEDNNNNLRLIFDIMLSEDKPLHLAVLYKNPDQVRKYINHYEDRDEGGRNALHLINSYSNDDRIIYDVLERFIPRDLRIYQILLTKCNPFEKDKLFGWNCLDYALYRNSLVIFEVMLETKLNEERIIYYINEIMKHFGDGFDTCIGSCCLYGYLHLLKTLIDRNFAVDIMDVEVEIEEKFIPRYVTPLHLASLTGNKDIIELLLKKGYNVNVVDELNETPLHFACRWGTYEAVKNILEFSGDLNAVTNKKQTPLHLAIENGNIGIIGLLLRKGCKINITDEQNWTPLYLACLYGRYDAIIKILDVGGDLNAVTNGKETPLHLASANGNIDIIELLLKKGLKINVTDEYHYWTPLHVAVLHGRYDAVKKILAHGGDLNAVSNKKQTPLHLALENGNIDIIEVLLKKGCKINVTDENNWTPLHLACIYGKSDAVIKILEVGGDLNAVTNEKQTPLHLAPKSKICTHQETKKIVKYLVENEVNINALDDKSWTPLRCACDAKNYDVIEVLLEHDAHLDEECRNILSQNFYDILRRGKVRLIEILLQRLTNTEMNGALSHFHSEFPIYLAKRNGHLQPDLLLKMVELINKIRGWRYFVDIGSSEDRRLLIEYLITNFDTTEEITLEDKRSIF